MEIQESIIDAVASFINCWIVENCHNDASVTVKISKVFVDQLYDISTVNQSCISLFALLMKSLDSGWLGAVCTPGSSLVLAVFYFI